MEATSVKILFFDIGGVLLTNGWGHESRREAAKKFGLDYAEVTELHTFIFNVYEMGSISLDEYLDTVVFNHPRDFAREDFKEFMFRQSARTSWYAEMAEGMEKRLWVSYNRHQ